MAAILDSSDELSMAKAAFIEAHGRFQSAHIQNDVAAWYAALSETLWWIFALDDYYCEHYPAKYESFRDSSPYGSVITGLKHARNSVGHSLALLVDYSYATHKKPGTMSLNSCSGGCSIMWIRPTKRINRRSSHN